jgi:hypothetical protein
MPVTGGVDTHKDTHVAAVLNAVGVVLGTSEFPTTPAGYRRLLTWMRGFGELTVVGVEGTGAWGAGLARQLQRHPGGGRGATTEPAVPAGGTASPTPPTRSAAACRAVR